MRKSFRTAVPNNKIDYSRLKRKIKKFYEPLCYIRASFKIKISKWKSKKLKTRVQYYKWRIKLIVFFFVFVKIFFSSVTRPRKKVRWLVFFRIFLPSSCFWAANSEAVRNGSTPHTQTSFWWSFYSSGTSLLTVFHVTFNFSVLGFNSSKLKICSTYYTVFCSGLKAGVYNC